MGEWGYWLKMVVWLFEERIEERIEEKDKKYNEYIIR